MLKKFSCFCLNRWNLASVLRVGVVLGALHVSACSSPGTPTSGLADRNPVGTSAIVVTPEQRKLIEDSVRSILDTASDVSVSRPEAVRLANQPGTHACGYVSFTSGDGKRRSDVPYYVELRENAGQPKAHRGQVAVDESKRAKVKFVCRHTGVQ